MDERRERDKEYAREESVERCICMKTMEWSYRRMCVREGMG